MPAQLAANPGGTALTLGTVNVDCTAVMPDPGAVAYPDQLRLDVVAFRVGSAPLTAGISRPWLLTACAAAFGMNEASVNAAADSTARRAGRRDTGTTFGRGHLPLQRANPGTLAPQGQNRAISAPTAHENPTNRCRASAATSSTSAADGMTPASNIATCSAGP